MNCVHEFIKKYNKNNCIVYCCSICNTQYTIQEYDIYILGKKHGAEQLKESLIKKLKERGILNE